MTTICIDDAGITSSRGSATDKRMTRLVNKSKTLRPDSPTTVQACNELGILVNDLKQKSIDDFKDMTVEDEIVELRFNHYMKRFNQTIKDVTAQKKKIARRNKTQLTQLLDSNNTQPHLESRSPNHASTLRNNSGIGIFQSQSTPLSPLSSALPKFVTTNFNKTLSYFRKAHDTSEVKSIDRILCFDESMMHNNDSPLEKFSQTLTNEVNRFNHIKFKKQNEAKRTYETELKRLQALQNIQDKQKKKEDQERAMSISYHNELEQKRKQFEEKDYKIKQMKSRYDSKLEKDKKSLDQKLQAGQLKHLKEAEEKRKQIAKVNEEEEQKASRAFEKRRQFSCDELRMSDQLKAEITNRLSTTNGKRTINLFQKSEKLRGYITQVEEDVKQHKIDNIKQNDQYIDGLIGGMIKKGEIIDAFQQKHAKECQKKRAESEAKSQRYALHQLDIKDKYEGRMNQINDRFQKFYENLESKKKADRKSRKIRQELGALKLQDTIEKNAKLQRQLEYERDLIFEKDKANKERIFWINSQKEFAQKARFDVAIQSKIESDKINGVVDKLTRIAYSSSQSIRLVATQKRLLNRILNPEDYKDYEHKDKGIIKTNHSQSDLQEGLLSVQATPKKRL